MPRGKPRPPKVPRTPPVVEFLRKAIGWQMLLASGQARNQTAIAHLEDVTDQKARFQELIGEGR